MFIIERDRKKSFVEGKANDNLETYQGLNGGDQMFTNLRRIKNKTLGKILNKVKLRSFQVQKEILLERERERERSHEGRVTN